MCATNIVLHDKRKLQNNCSLRSKTSSEKYFIRIGANNFEYTAIYFVGWSNRQEPVGDKNILLMSGEKYLETRDVDHDWRDATVDQVKLVHINCLSWDQEIKYFLPNQWPTSWGDAFTHLMVLCKDYYNFVNAGVKVRQYSQDSKWISRLSSVFLRLFCLFLDFLIQLFALNKFG